MSRVSPVVSCLFRNRPISLSTATFVGLKFLFLGQKPWYSKVVFLPSQALSNTLLPGKSGGVSVRPLNRLNAGATDLRCFSISAGVEPCSVAVLRKSLAHFAYVLTERSGLKSRAAANLSTTLSQTF